MRFINIRRCSFFIAIFLKTGLLVSAQTISVVDGTLPLGVTPAAAYPLSGFDHYDPFSGALSAAIPLHHIGGRGEAGFDLVWNFQQTWVAAKRYGGSTPFIPIDPYPNNNLVGPQGIAGPLGAGAVFNRTGSSLVSCSNGAPSVLGITLARIVFETPDGGQTELIDQNTNGQPYQIQSACTQLPATCDANRGKIFRSTDGSSLEFISDSDVLDNTAPGFGESDAKVSGNLLFPNGVVYRIDNSDVSWIRDRNGNKITFEYNSGQVIPVTWYLFVDAPSQIVDSLGRTVTLNYSDSSCGGCTTITYPGTGGNARVTQIVQAHLSSGLLRSDFPSVQTIDQLFPSTGQPTYSFDPILASYIQFPDGRRFTFQYDTYGELARITLPTAGAIEYDYGDGHNSSTDGFEGVTTDNNPVLIYRRLHQRREYSAGGTAGAFTSKTVYSVSYPGAQAGAGGNTYATEQIYDSSGNFIRQTAPTMHGA